MALHRIILSCICLWCILAILGENLLRRSRGHLAVMIRMDGCADIEDVIEPMVRRLRLEFQVFGIEPWIALDLNGCRRECRTMVRKLVDDGILFAEHRGVPDLVLLGSRLCRFFPHKEVFHEAK